MFQDVSSGAAWRIPGAHLGAGAEALTSPPVEKEVGPGLMTWMIDDLES
jgi:hypothetical protein